MSEPRWGERRATVHQRVRRRWIVGSTTVLVASPFALSAMAQHWQAVGGAMPNGRFPLWIPILYWFVVATIALIGASRLYRASDEFERRRLVDGFAVSGVLLGLLVPPLFFLDFRFGIIFAWIVAFVAGLVVFARPRITP